MLSSERKQPKITNKRSKKTLNTNLDTNSRRDCDLRKPELTSNDLFKPDANTEAIVKRTSSK